MSTNTATTRLGNCPNCDATLSVSDPHVRYREFDWPVTITECRTCDVLVHPV